MIKYRVYDTQEKKYRDDLYFFIAPNGELLWSYELTNGLYPTDPQRFIIEQYIGKDNNGVDIFAGDILRCTIRSIDEFVTCTIVVKEGLRCGDLSYCERFAVIGNIHENAELLEEK